MSRVEDLCTELVTPELFREICTVVANVSKKCVISTRNAATSSQGQDEDEEVVVNAVNFQNTMQLWVHLSSDNMFRDFKLTNAECVELSADTLAQAFKNEAGVVSMTEVKMRITHKISRQVGATDANASQAAPQNHRLISFHMSNKNADGTATKVVEQRIVAEYVAPDMVLVEPIVDGIQDWADPTTSQLEQMAKVCEQYKQMNDRVRVIISTIGVMTLKSEASDVVATTSWRVEKAERANASQEEREESLFVDDEAEVEDGEAGSPQRRLVPRTESSAVLLVKDWQIVLQARKMCRRMVIGVLHNKGLVAYGFLKQGRHSSTQDVATFYLWHQD